MDTDLKPVQAPLVNPEKPAEPKPMPDPFKPDDPPLPQAPRSKRRGGKGKKILLLLLVLLFAAAVGGGVYFWQEQRVKDTNNRVQELNNEVIELQQQVDELEAAEQNLEKEAEDQAATAEDTDALAIAASKAYCQASVDPATKQAHVFTVVNSAGDKQVLYSADNGFATVTATCGTAAAPGQNQTYYLKSIDDQWVVVHAGALTPAITELYNIPTTFN